MMNRISQVVEKEILNVNYGVLIAYVQGIFERALNLFPYAKMIYLDE